MAVRTQRQETRKAALSLPVDLLGEMRRLVQEGKAQSQGVPSCTPCCSLPCPHRALRTRDFLSPRSMTTCVPRRGRSESKFSGNDRRQGRAAIARRRLKPRGLVDVRIL
jgi:hypothetical protein